MLTNPGAVLHTYTHTFDTHAHAHTYIYIYIYLDSYNCTDRHTAKSLDITTYLLPTYMHPNTEGSTQVTI